MADTDKKLAQLENIKNNSKDYRNIERTAEQKANDIFSNKKAMLAAAIIAVLAALRNDPNKQLSLIYGSDYPSNSDVDLYHYISSIMSAQHPENYLQFNQRKLLEIVEQFYDRMLKIAVNNTIHILSNSATKTNHIETN